MTKVYHSLGDEYKSIIFIIMVFLILESGIMLWVIPNYSTEENYSSDYIQNVNAIVSFLAVLIALIALIENKKTSDSNLLLARETLNESIKLREIETLPIIFTKTKNESSESDQINYAHVKQKGVVLLLCNHGKTPAREIDIRTDVKFPKEAFYLLCVEKEITSRLESLNPSEEVRVGNFSIQWVAEQLALNKNFTIYVDYVDIHGNRHIDKKGFIITFKESGVKESPFYIMKYQSIRDGNVD